MQTHPYVAFEGPIAAGKTTLAELLATHLGSQLVLEEFEGNEFLDDFYNDRDRWSLPAQLWFLAARRKQLDKISRPLSRSLVGDYSYWKGATFAQVLLRDRELRLFNRLDGINTSTLVSPDLIVYLDATDDALLQRIWSRGRPYELTIDRDYLESLRRAYENTLLRSSKSMVLRLDTSNLDIKCEIQITGLCEAIKAAIP